MAFGSHKSFIETQRYCLRLISMLFKRTFRPNKAHNESLTIQNWICIFFIGVHLRCIPDYLRDPNIFFNNYYQFFNLCVVYLLLAGKENMQMSSLGNEEIAFHKLFA